MDNCRCQSALLNAIAECVQWKVVTFDLSPWPDGNRIHELHAMAQKSIQNI
jgi:hypothetical protein